MQPGRLDRKINGVTYNDRARRAEEGRKKRGEVGIAAAGNWYLQDRPQAPALPYTSQDQGHGPCFADEGEPCGKVSSSDRHHQSNDRLSEAFRNRC